MAQLTKERDTLLQTINAFQGFFQTTDKLVEEMKCKSDAFQYVLGDEHLTFLILYFLMLGRVQIGGYSKG
jgi:hypothetical protein